MCSEPKEEIVELNMEPEEKTPNVITLNKGHGGVEITIQSSDSSIIEIEQIIEVLMRKYGGYNE